MKTNDRAVLVTGANRGIGRALVEEALSRGAERVYAATRQPFIHSDERVTNLTLDVTNAEQIQRAVEGVESLDILINNAGLTMFDDLSDRAAIERLLAVNLFGTYGVTQAFLPLLTSSRGAIVNILSMAGLAAVPFSPAYSISKAAAFSLTQSLRALWARRGVKVHAVLAGPVDTDMSRNLEILKASPESVAQAIFDGLENDDEDIFPDLMSQSVAEGWRNGAPRRWSASLQRSCPARPNKKFRGGTRVPSMHRKRSSDDRRSRILGRNSGGVHRQVQKIFQREWPRSVSGNKGEMIWQQAKRETRSTRKGISR
jgi:NAD(P)-dependent dehydrogenase (short-subunit alcohol dehydrogenase family)